MPNQSIAQPTAAELLARFDSGDGTALRSLHERYYHRLLQYGLTLSDREAVVEDQVQEIFLWLLEHQGKLDHIRNVETYLFGALRNNLYRVGAEASRVRALFPPAHHFVLETTKDPIGESEENDRMRQAEAEFIRTELAKLPPRRREVIHLRYVEGYGFSDIAKIMGISSQVARNYASRGLKTLRNCITEYWRRVGQGGRSF